MAPDFKKLRAELQDLEAAHRDRLAEANVLMTGGHFGTAMALALYALEIALKVRVCKVLELDKLPEAFQTHDLDGLLNLSGLKRRFDGLGNNQTKVNWNNLRTTAKLINDMRYKPNTNWKEEQAKDVLDKIQDPKFGVITWILAQT